MTILGTVDLRDWDTGAVTTLGGEITQYVVDGDTRAVYTIDVAGLESGIPLLDNKVPCYYDTPEDVYQEVFLPNFTFKRTELTPAFERQPWYQFVARAPAKGANKITLADGRVGYDRYANQFRANPFDISYEVLIQARRSQESMLMLTHLLKHYIPNWFVFTIEDSLGDKRQYDAGEMSISNASELIDMADRMIGWMVSFIVRGEIDIIEDREYPAVTSPPNVTYERFNPNPGG